MVLAEVRVLIPEKRVGEFYRVVGAWMEGDTSPPASTPEASLSPKSRYAAFHQHLAGIDVNGKAYSMAFADIGAVLGKPLPQSAYDHRAWWANTHSHAQALAWLTAGWKVDHIDLGAEKVDFIRQPTG